MTYELTGNHAYNVDCMELMREVPDKYFELACVDVPYGAGTKEDGIGLRFHGGDRWNKYTNGNRKVDWDVAPPKKYFEELIRISKNQIIWGGNYFELSRTRCFIVWRKTNIPTNGFSMSPIEYAWTSFDKNASIYEASSARVENSGGFHPTEKPIELYTWLFTNYAKQGDKILDTHLGSGSSRIAAYELGLDFIGCEIDGEYFAKQEERFAVYTAQTSLFH